MKLIYQNFDGLDVTFQGRIPTAMQEQLEEARNEAQQTKKQTYVELGVHKVKGHVAENGAKGGYRYRLDTGPDGETWFFAKSDKLNAWNIRVSVHSLSLALYGYAKVKERLIEKLRLLEAEGIEGAPLERISRMDYCFDFHTTESFNPDPKRFVAHGSCKKDSFGEQFVTTQGSKTYTVRIGKMPGRQVVLYNKTAEIRSSGKSYWHQIWNLDRYDPGTVWRVEVRAGKNELDKWNVKRFSEFERKAGDIILSILNAIRYVEPSHDVNRSRWPNAQFWSDCVLSASEALAEYRCQAVREKVLTEHRLNIQNRYRTNIFGNILGFVAASNESFDAAEAVSEALKREFQALAKDDRQRLLAKFEALANRFKTLG